MRSLYMHVQWNYCDICKIVRIRTHLKWWVFKKISFTKNYKIGLFPSSSFTMKKCTNLIHLPDYDRTWANLSVDAWSIFVLCLVAETWACENWSTAKNFTASGGGGGGTHLIPHFSERMRPSHMRTPDPESTYLLTSTVKGGKLYMHDIVRIVPEISPNVHDSWSCI